MRGIIYGYRNKCNDMWYVGQTRHPKSRQAEHIKRARYCREEENCPLFYRDVNIYGWDSFEYHVLEKDVELCDLNRLEQFYGLKYDSLENGYNEKIGGGKYTSISKALSRKISKNTSSEKNGMYGRKGYDNPVSIPIIEIHRDGTTKTYPNAESFIEEKGDPSMRRRAISFCCGKKNVVYLKQHFICYEKDYGEWANKIMYDFLDSLEFKAKEIVEVDDCMNIKKRYSGIESMCEELDVAESVARYHLVHKTYSVYERVFYLNEEYEKFTKEELVALNSPKPRKKKISAKDVSMGVICVNDNQHYKTVDEIISKYGLNRSSIMGVLNNKRESCGKQLLGVEMKFIWVSKQMGVDYSRECDLIQ
ncbi:MAG: hypothetical protein ACRC0F_10960 [Cetobacterium sp.]